MLSIPKKRGPASLKSCGAEGLEIVPCVRIETVLPHTRDLFDADTAPVRKEALAEGACVLRSFASAQASGLLDGVRHIERLAPFRHLQTPRGLAMSVAMTNCGALGWVSDRRGYRYEGLDPDSGRPWPPMPASFHALATAAALAAGFTGFQPDACLMNRYVPGTRLSLHQDKDEQEFISPIVSVSLGLPAIFLFGGNTRSERQQRVALGHGDVVVWGGTSRLFHHGILPLKHGWHPLLGSIRLNLTFRRASMAERS